MTRMMKKLMLSPSSYSSLRNARIVRSTSSFYAAALHQPSRQLQQEQQQERFHSTVPNDNSNNNANHHSFIPYPVIRKDDFGPNQEYSVIHTDRSLNLMSIPFQTVMKDLYYCFNHTYRAAHTIIIPGYVFLICVCACDGCLPEDLFWKVSHQNKPSYFVVVFHFI